MRTEQGINQRLQMRRHQVNANTGVGLSKEVLNAIIHELEWVLDLDLL